MATPTPPLLYFPVLHPALASPQAARSVRFFDPGLAGGEGGAWYRPADLPLDAAALKGFLREFERLRREVKNPGDLSLLAGANQGHFFADTTFALRDELADALDPARPAGRQRRAAQLSLCLAWQLEEALLELSAAGGAETSFRQAMAESLGLEAEDVEELQSVLPGGAVLPEAALAEEFGAPWDKVLPALWLLLPEGPGLFVEDGGIVADWLEAGIPFAAPAAGEAQAWFGGEGPCGTLLAARVPGWRLLGRNRPSKEAPWLDTARLVVLCRT